MRKWMFSLLLLGNVVFFSVMYWGDALTEDVYNPSVQAELNADKMKLLPPGSNDMPMPAVQAASSVAASSVIASSSVLAGSAVLPETVQLDAKPTKPRAERVKLSCMKWGEFSGVSLQRVQRKLHDMNLGKHLKLRAVEHASVYWVYMGPLKTQSRIARKIAQLNALGVEDHFVVRDAGIWHNTISLGVFKTKLAAKRYLAKLRKQGVRTASLGKRESKLKFTIFELDRIDDSMSSHITSLAKKFPKVELKVVPCE